jgi:hypothetical protein
MSTALANPTTEADLTEARLAAQAYALGEVARIMALEDEYDDDFLRPTPKVTELTCRLLTDAAIAMKRPLPKADIGPIGDGGIAIQWGGGNDYVHLFVPPTTSAAYIYARTGLDVKEHSAGGEALALCLDRLPEG